MASTKITHTWRRDDLLNQLQWFLVQLIKKLKELTCDICEDQIDCNVNINCLLRYQLHIKTIPFLNGYFRSAKWNTHYKDKKESTCDPCRVGEGGPFSCAFLGLGVLVLGGGGLLAEEVDWMVPGSNPDNNNDRLFPCTHCQHNGRGWRKKWDQSQ